MKATATNAKRQLAKITLITVAFSVSSELSNQCTSDPLRFSTKGLMALQGSDLSCAAVLHWLRSPENGRSLVSSLLLVTLWGSSFFGSDLQFSPSGPTHAVERCQEGFLQWAQVAIDVHQDLSGQMTDTEDSLELSLHHFHFLAIFPVLYWRHGKSTDWHPTYAIVAVELLALRVFPGSLVPVTRMESGFHAKTEQMKINIKRHSTAWEFNLLVIFKRNITNASSKISERERERERVPRVYGVVRISNFNVPLGPVSKMPIDELGGNKRLDPVRSNALSQGEGRGVTMTPSNPVLQDISTKRQGMNFEILFQTSRPWQGSAWPVQKSQLTIINVCLTVKQNPAHSPT